MTRTYDILAFGDTCVDLILRDDDVVPRFAQVEKIVADYALVMGGSSCIFAAQAAKLGMTVALLGRVGGDAFGDFIVESLSAAGVDTTHITVDRELRTGLTVHLVQGGDRAMLTYPGSSQALTAADLRDEHFQMARHLHYGSLFLQAGLLPDWINILRRAKAHGMSTSLDTNWDPSETWNIDLHSAATLLDIMMPNAQEAMRLSGAGSMEEAAERLSQQVPLLVIKRGADGAIARQGNRKVECEVEAAETGGDGIGAGDSFAAGFLAGWLDGLPIEACLSIGCACGRGAASERGGLRGQLLRADIAGLSSA